jgi:CRISPR-associated protein Csd1
MRKVFTSIYSGSLKTTDDDYFYILGLAPAAARIAAVYWSEQKLVDFAGKILRHFDDMEIIDTRKEKFPYSGLFSILGSVTVSGKSSDIKSNLPEAVTRSIFDGTPYPYALYSQCIGRIRALGKNEIKIVQAAILKGYLNRLNDKSSNKISVMLDKNNSNQGYLCGRLFAVLVKIQEDGSGNNSIKERYMNAASATPSAVFSTLLNLSSHQQENLNDGSKVFYEKLICEIISKIDATGFPTTLGIQDQGRFFVGYYQQRQDLFTSKKDSNNQ